MLRISSLDQELFNAVKRGDIHEVRELIGKGTNINAKDSTNGKKPIHVAAMEGHKNVIEFLLSNGVRVDDTDKDDWTPLHTAAYNGHLDIVKYLIDEKEADFTVISKDGSTPLHYATYNGQLDTVKYLIDEKKNDFTVTNKYGSTPLLLAAQNSHLNVVKYLVDEKGADVFVRNNHDTVLHRAVSSDNEEVIRLILEAIQEKDPQKMFEHINAQDTEGDTPLMWAAEKGKVSAARILLEYEAGFNVKNNDGKTALHWAASHWNGLNIVKLLVKGTNINAADRSGNTPLHLAIKSGKLDTIEYLIDKRADINIKDSDGRTFLHWVAMKGRLDIVKYLIDKVAGNVILVKGKNRGRDAWHYVLVDKDKKEMFLAKLDTGSIDVADYGKILCSGWGQDLPEDIKDKIEEEYFYVEDKDGKTAFDLAKEYSDEMYQELIELLSSQLGFTYKKSVLEQVQIQKVVVGEKEAESVNYYGMM